MMRLRLARLAVRLAFIFEPRHPHRKMFLDALRGDK
jgi:hypothetical protein